VRYDDVIVGVRYHVSIPDRWPCPTFEIVSGSVPDPWDWEADEENRHRRRVLPSSIRNFPWQNVGRVIATEKPWVLVEFTAKEMRRLPPHVGHGYEVDENGEPVYDDFPVTAKVKPTRIDCTPEEKELQNEAFRWAIHQPGYMHHRLPELTEEFYRLREQSIANEAETFLKGSA
jgi:hypothetical protein